MHDLRRCTACLLVLLVAGCGGGSSGDVIVLNPGDGLPIESFQGMAVADMNNDGLPDIVAASHWFDGVGATEDRLNTFLQDAANPGTFLPRSIDVHAEGGGIWQVAAVDVDLDGVVEVLFKSIEFTGFALFEPDPADPGHFLAPRRFGNAAEPSADSADAFAVADIDGDAYPDLVVTAGEDVWLFPQLPAANEFGPGVRAGSGAGPIAVADFDADGAVDLATFAIHRNGDGIGVRDTWHFHRQDASNPGRFLAPVDYAIDSVGWALGAADLDNDGRPDVVINSSRADDEYLTVFRRTATGGFTRLPQVVTRLDGLLGEQAISDLDGDGRPEIIAGMNTAALDPQLIQIYSQDATGAYRAGTLLTIPYPEVGQPFLYALHVDDFDGDGQPDIVVSTDEIFLFLQRRGSPGEFLPATRIAAQR